MQWARLRNRLKSSFNRAGMAENRDEILRETSARGAVFVRGVLLEEGVVLAEREVGVR